MRSKIIIVFISALIAMPASLAFADGTPGGFWDMAGPVVSKVISVPTNEPNYPAGRTNKERQLLENSAGDLVFGIWREDNNAFLQNPALDNGALEFYGGQTAYIEDVLDRVTNFKISFEIKPSRIDALMDIFDNPQTWNIRIEPGAGDNEGMARLRFYAHTFIPALQERRSRSVNTDWTLEVDQWHTVEAWVIDSRAYIKLDGVENTPDGAFLETGLHVGLFPTLFMGSRWDGDRRHFEGSMRNLELTYYEDTCGAWGHHPLDFNRDCFVGLSDFAHFATYWLECTDPQIEGCVPAN